MPRPFAKKSLGQNFLVDQNYIRRIIEALDPQLDDTIIEIGPGRGAITERLVESGANVIAIELDRELVPLLRDRFADHGNFRIVEADATEIDFAHLAAPAMSAEARGKKYKVVANLPYYISTAILQYLSTQRRPFSCLVLMFQKEVVERITAEPGNSARGFLTVMVESAFTVEKLFNVPSNAFRPVPKVESAVASFVPKPGSIETESGFYDLVSTGFSQKRKTIYNNLRSRFPDAKEALEKAGIDANQRAESLTLADWTALFNNLK